MAAIEINSYDNSLLVGEGRKVFINSTNVSSAAKIENIKDDKTIIAYKLFMTGNEVYFVNESTFNTIKSKM